MARPLLSTLARPHWVTCDIRAGVKSLTPKIHSCHSYVRRPNVLIFTLYSAAQQHHHGAVSSFCKIKLEMISCINVVAYWGSAEHLFQSDLAWGSRHHWMSLSCIILVKVFNELTGRYHVAESENTHLSLLSNALFHVFNDFRYIILYSWTICSTRSLGDDVRVTSQYFFSDTSKSAANYNHNIIIILHKKPLIYKYNSI